MLGKLVDNPSRRCFGVSGSGLGRPTRIAAFGFAVVRPTIARQHWYEPRPLVAIILVSGFYLSRAAFIVGTAHDGFPEWSAP